MRHIKDGADWGAVREKGAKKILNGRGSNALTTSASNTLPDN